jgi:hypothetical protein
MKEMFEKPVMEMIEFDSEDIIITSACSTNCSPHCIMICTDDCQVVSRTPAGCSDDLT